MTKEVENNNTVSNHSKKISQEELQFFPVNTFQIGSCLFWATALAYLTDLKFYKPSLSQEEYGHEVYDLQFHMACTTLFGEIGNANEKKLKRLIDQFYVTHDLTFIYRSSLVQDLIFLFRQEVVNYIDQHRETFQRFIHTDFDSYLSSMRAANKFAGKVEIEAIAALLNCSIEVINRKTHLHLIYPFHANNQENFCKSKSVHTRNLRLFKDSEEQYCFALEKIGKLTKSGFLKSAFFHIDVPKDHSCLFWAAAIAYLISIGGGQFEEACRTLFGSFSTSLEAIKAEITDYRGQNLENIQKNYVFANLVRISFRRQVVNYMSLHRNEFEFETNNIEDYLEQMLSPKTWGSWQEVKAIGALLKCKIFLFLSWDKNLQEPLSCGSGEPILYLFHDHKSNHYYFGQLKNEIKLRGNNFKEVSDFELSSSQDRKAILRKKLNTKKTIAIAKSLKQNLFNDLIKGISIGLFLETSLWILASTPLVKFFILDQNNRFYKELKFKTLIESPYFYFKNYQEFVLKPTEFDKFLNNLFDKERVFVWGIVLGMAGGFIKYFIDTEDTEKFLITLGIFMSVLPSNYLHGNLEVAQLLVRCMLMLFLSLSGLLSIIDFSLPCARKVSDSVSFSVKKLSNKIPSFFSKKNEEEKAMDLEISLQSDTRASL